MDSFLQGHNSAIGEILKPSADGTRSTPHAVVTAAENGSYYCTDPQNGNRPSWIVAGELQNVAVITGLCH